MTDLITDVTNYLASLPSHVRERQAAKLLVRCRDELAQQAEYIAGQQQTIRSMQQSYSVEACHRQLDEIDRLKKRIAELSGEQP